MGQGQQPATADGAILRHQDLRLPDHRVGAEGWACDKLAPEDGETPVDGIFVKERCRKEIDERTSASLATRHLRKAGQSPIDPRTGRETTGQFESSVRFELVRGK